MTTFAPEAPAHPSADSPTVTPPSSGKRLRRLLFGTSGDPRWARPALLALLAVTALLYLWDLSGSGYANSFYAAAVQAGTKSWKAMFFGSSDSSNFITVDKPPASLWVMEISARIFGFNSWSLLVPQALEGVAAVGLLYSAVRRWASPAAGLLAGAVLALTPVAALMFRFDNPDSLLVLLLIAAAYALLRAVESGRTRWLALVGLLVGTGFLTKMMQAFVVVPVFVGVYLLAGPAGWARRVRQLLLGGIVLVAASLWWVVAVELVPAADRPYIGGSQDNSLWNLIFGYNGFGRLTGNESGSVGTNGNWGATGLLRMFNAEMGGQISWLIPAALIFLGGGLWLGRRAARTDLTRATYLVWGGWLLFTGLLFSFSKGIIHPYYTVALAPAIGALVGIGAVSLWQRRAQWPARSLLAAAVLSTGIWGFVLLNRSSDFYPWVRYVSLLGALAFAAALLGLRRVGGKVALSLAAVGLIAALAGPAAYTAQTVTTAHTGAIPSAGPTTGSGFGGGFGGRGGSARPGGGFGGATGGTTGGTAPTGGGFAGGTAPTGGGIAGGTAGGAAPTGAGSRTGGGAAGGIGGLLGSTTPSAALTAALKAGASSYTWVAATVGSNNAAGYQLASGDAVMAIGGFNGTDPAPSLAQFEKYVAEGKIHYFIPGSTGASAGVATQITTWVESHFTASTVGGTTVYDLSATASASS